MAPGDGGNGGAESRSLSRIEKPADRDGDGVGIVRRHGDPDPLVANEIGQDIAFGCDRGDTASEIIQRTGAE